MRLLRVLRRLNKKSSMIIWTLITIVKKEQICLILILKACLRINTLKILVSTQKSTPFTLRLTRGKIFISIICVCFSLRDKFKVIAYQQGVVRTNCFDCLERTNSYQTKIALSMLSERYQFSSDPTIEHSFLNLWGL
jgi:hypothetical protein